MTRRPKIVLGVTVDISLTLMRGLPAFLASEGWEVHVVTSPGPHLEGLVGISGVVAHAIPMKRNPSPLRDIVSLFSWISLLRNIRPDVISVGTPKAGLLGGIAGWLTGVPKRVYHLRGLRLETAGGVQLAILAAMEKLTARVATHVLSVSHSLRDRVVEGGLVPADKIVVLGSGSSNGVQLEDFDQAAFTVGDIEALRDQLGVLPDLPVIGFVGRLTEDKGLSVLAQAREILEKDGVDYQMLVVGGFDGPEGEDQLAAVNAHGRPALVSGYVSRPAIYYRLMDIFCLPTLREGYPNVVLEASASSLPTVTTNATGAFDSTIDGLTGLIASAGDATMLALALRSLIERPELRVEMGRNALARVSTEFSREQVWQLLKDYYAVEALRAARP
ncbi:glycosyltransferase family 1 protein [Cryobacterium sp. Hz7]|uniref:glycosyltransferase family 4 protein n=1 Tax=Cryobacterium sp. Hz7 TaxID=1259166 RepID=UPI00106D240B|nr:glycosyltransferase family 4 protein [Cryobacterium sp. Hz7]TFB66754.1 glycosyltransferase family 1 protein [Cryobacterium sp. Hz7]